MHKAGDGDRRAWGASARLSANAQSSMQRSTAGCFCAAHPICIDWPFCTRVAKVGVQPAHQVSELEAQLEHTCGQSHGIHDDGDQSLNDRASVGSCQRCWKPCSKRLSGAEAASQRGAGHACWARHSNPQSGDQRRSDSPRDGEQRYRICRSAAAAAVAAVPDRNAAPRLRD